MRRISEIAQRDFNYDTSIKYVCVGVLTQYYIISIYIIYVRAVVASAHRRPLPALLLLVPFKLQAGQRGGPTQQPLVKAAEQVDVQAQPLQTGHPVVLGRQLL